MKAEELRSLTVEELKSKIEDLRGELFNLRFQKATGQIENPLQIRVVRRNIARALTILREKELKGEK